MLEERRFGPVRFIPGTNSGKYPYCHSLYIEGAGVLIDPASDRERLERLKVDEGVKAVWLSHWHEDHFMHLDLFDDVPLYTSQPDAAPLSDLETLMDAYGFDENERTDWRPLFTSIFNFRPRRPAGFLAEGAPIDLGGLTVDMLHTPGHTPGHLAFFFHEPRVLFLGDYDLTKFGPWYGDTGSDIDLTIASVKRLQTVPADIRIGAHEDGVIEDAPDSLWKRYLAVIDTREGKLLDLLRTPRTMDEIVQACIVYGRPREPKNFFAFGERALMGKHLERLMAQGVVAKEGDHFHRV